MGIFRKNRKKTVIKRSSKIFILTFWPISEKEFSTCQIGKKSKFKILQNLNYVEKYSENQATWSIIEGSQF